MPGYAQYYLTMQVQPGGRVLCSAFAKGEEGAVYAENLWGQSFSDWTRFWGQPSIGMVEPNAVPYNSRLYNTEHIFVDGARSTVNLNRFVGLDDSDSE